MVNVAYVTLAPIISGAERALQTILLNANSHGINPLVICPEDSPIKSWLESNNINYEVSPLKTFCKLKPLDYIFQIFDLYRILKRYDVDVVHSNQIWSYKPLGYLCNKLGIKTVCHFRDPIDSDSEWWLPSKMDHAICISHHVEKELRESISPRKCEKIHTRLDPVYIPENLSQGELKLRRTEAKANLIKDITQEKCICYGFVGQIAKVKGLHHIISTLALLRSYPWVLLVAGKCEKSNEKYFSDCKALADNLGVTDKIKFLGFQDNLESFYHCVDLVLMFSEREPLGLIPLEAAARYTPSMASNIDGLPETICDNETGWLVDPNRYEKNALIITQLSTEKLSQAGIKARRRVESICSVSSYMEFLNSIYLSDEVL